MSTPPNLTYTELQGRESLRKLGFQIPTTYTELQSHNAHAAADLLLANSLTWTGEVSAEQALDHVFAALYRCRAGVSKGSIGRAVDLLRRQADAWAESNGIPKVEESMLPLRNPAYDDGPMGIFTDYAGCDSEENNP